MLNFDNLFLTTTDTIVGIGAPISKENKKAIFTIKKRSKKKSLIIMVGSIDQAQKLKGWNQKADSFAKKYWPGQVTLVINKDLAVRMPLNKPLCDLILKIGPVYMTSANISGKKDLSLDEAKKQFIKINKYYDFGKGNMKPSTIININTEEILR